MSVRDSSLLILLIRVSIKGVAARAGAGVGAGAEGGFKGPQCHSSSKIKRFKGSKGPPFPGSTDCVSCLWDLPIYSALFSGPIRLSGLPNLA